MKLPDNYPNAHPFYFATVSKSINLTLASGGCKPTKIREIVGYDAPLLNESRILPEVDVEAGTFAVEGITMPRGKVERVAKFLNGTILSHLTGMHPYRRGALAPFAQGWSGEQTIKPDKIVGIGELIEGEPYALCGYDSVLLRPKPGQALAITAPTEFGVESNFTRMASHIMGVSAPYEAAGMLRLITGDTLAIADVSDFMIAAGGVAVCHTTTVN